VFQKKVTGTRQQSSLLPCSQRCIWLQLEQAMREAMAMGYMNAAKGFDKKPICILVGDGSQFIGELGTERA
jgi:hypothetical protein